MSTSPATLTPRRAAPAAETAPRIDAVELLRLLRDGGAAYDCSAALGELVQAVVETGKGGSLSLTIKVTPAAEGNASKVLILDDIAVKFPKVAHLPSYFYTTDDGRLSRHNPNQVRRGAAASDESVPEDER